jgi:glycosyltransferase involved in cell wall biosynthesis
VGVTVVIAAHNQLSTLPLSLRSMAVQTTPPERVIVADDGSSDGTCEWLDAVPAWPFPVGYVTHPHFGYGLAVIENLGASFVEAGRILFTNADVVHHPGSVGAHGGMKEGQVAGGRVREVALAASTLARVSDIDDFSGFERLFEENRGGLSNHDYIIRDPGSNIYGIWGGNFSVDAWRFHEVRGFDERYRLMYGGEEADLVKRLVRRGALPAWAYNSTAYHLAHPPRAYGESALGNTKYRMEHLAK